MYEYKKQVLFSDIDRNNNMTLDSLVSAIQDCININSEAIGKGINYMKETGHAWFAVAWNFHIDRLPRLMENITVKTWPYDFSATMGFRNIIVCDENENVIVATDSVWALMDMEQGRPTKISESDSAGYDLEPRYNMEPMARKIKLPDNINHMDTISVKRADIDFNGHMTNGRYIEIADEYTPIDKTIKKIRAEYKSQSVYGEILNVYSGYNDDKLVVAFRGENDSLKATVEFTL